MRRLRESGRLTMDIHLIVYSTHVTLDLAEAALLIPGWVRRGSERDTAVISDPRTQ